MSQSHLIHGAINMKQFHGSGTGPYFIELSILVFFEESGLVTPDWLIVYVVLPWFSMAIGCFY